MDCGNPFAEKDAEHSEEIAYLIIYKDKLVKICINCADSIAGSDKEW